MPDACAQLQALTRRSRPTAGTAATPTAATTPTATATTAAAAAGKTSRPGTPAAGANPWVLSAGAAPPPQVVSGFTAATGVIVLLTGAVVSWSLY